MRVPLQLSPSQREYNEHFVHNDIPVKSGERRKLVDALLTQIHVNIL